MLALLFFRLIKTSLNMPNNLLQKLGFYGTIIVLHNFLYSRRPKLGKSVGFARHIRLDVKLCSNNERDLVFRCAVSATHFFDFGGML